MKHIDKVYSITISTDKGTFVIVPEDNVSIEMNSEYPSFTLSDKKFFSIKHTFDIQGRFNEAFFIQ